MVRFIGMVGHPRRNFMEMASWSRASEHLVNPIGMSDQLKWNNHQADSLCTKCGLCVIKCPTGAINKDNPQVTDKSKCISCMRCVAVCPNHARSLDQDKMAVIETAIKKVCSIKKECELFL